MQTGLHQWLLNNYKGWLIFDIAFYTMPLFLLLSLSKSNKAISAIIAIGMLIVNWIYIQIYSLYPSASIESFCAWLLFPALFITTSLTNFYYLLHALRYFFLFFFTSAAFWKFVQLGVFNPRQMSGVLLFQHKEYLASSPGFWYANFIYWLIRHHTISYLLYLTATLCELTFAIGFFTKKADNFLIIIFILFLTADSFIMRISYWEMIPFILTLLFSKYSKASKFYKAAA